MMIARSRLVSLLLSLVTAAAVILVPFALGSGPAQGDIGEAGTAAVADAQRLVGLGALHTCAVTDAGTVQCWGNNDFGQLGNGTKATTSTPTQVSGLIGVKQVAAGAQHTCALRHGGTIWCWGFNANGELGDNDLALLPTTTPVQVVGVSGATALAAGSYHNCALLADGTVACWGSDGMGQLGDGTPGDYSITATPVPGITVANPAIALAAGEFHTCAVLADHTVTCWGHNGSGQLGDGTTTDRSVPTPVVGLPTPVASNPALAVTAGNSHTCVVVGGPNRAYCWGLNKHGELGHATGSMAPSATPLLVQFDNDPTPLTQDLMPLTGTVSVAAGQFHTCAKVGPGVWCWGMNGHGQLGADPVPGGDYEDSTYALNVPGLTAAAVVAGGEHTCAVMANQVLCWGYNFHGQLGSYAPSSAVPVTVTAVTGAFQVAAGTDFACTLAKADVDRRLFCWGSNADGRLGSDSPVAMTTIRQPVDSVGDVGELDLGNGQGCLRLPSSDQLRCWGRNADGELGDGTTTARSDPVPSVGSVTAYDAGGSFEVPSERGTTCAVRTSGKASCWGENGHGQLGDNTTTDSSTPVTVRYDSDPDPDNVVISDLTGVDEVAVGGFHACALMASTRVRCWGANGNGQLGDNSSDERHLAVLVQDDDDPDTDTPLSGVSALVAGARHTCAQMLDGSVRCWGANNLAQLGDGTTTQRSNATKKVRTNNPFPVAPGDLGNALSIASGDNHVCALRGDKGVVCWGDNSFQQAGGGGATAVYAIPKPPNSFPGPLVTSLAASRKNTCVTLIDTTVQCWGDNSQGQLGDGIGTKSIVPLVVGALPSVAGNHIPSPVPDSVDTTPGVALDIDALANDTDPDGDALTITGVGPTVNGTASVVAGQVHYVPAPGCHDETFSYDVSDGTATVASTISVLMNCAPTAVADQATTAEDTAKDITVLVNDTDPENDPLTVAAVDDPASGSATILGSGAIRYTPDPDLCSPPADSFGYTIDDGHGHQATATVTVTVTCANDGPAAGGDVASTPEETPVLIDVLGNDADPDGDSLTLSGVGAPAHGSATQQGQQVQYTPAADYCGSDSFTYTVSDGHGTASGTVTVTVTCVADSPRPATDRATTAEDTSVLIDVLANDVDPDGGSLSLGPLGDPAHGTLVAESGKVRYTPDADYCGPDSTSYAVSSGSGSATGTIELTVTCVNDAPVAADDVASTPEDTTVHVHVLLNDSDVDANTLVITSATGASHGTLSTAITDAVAYTPAPGYCGPDQFDYTIDDGHGGTATATVHVTVVCVNQAPVAAAIADQATAWGNQVDVPLSATDPDGDPLSWTMAGGPAGAAVTTAGEFLWTPTSTQIGGSQVTVTVSDGLATDQRTFTVQVSRRATALSWDGAVAGQVSDQVLLRSLLVDAGTGAPLPSQQVTLSQGGTSIPATTGGDGRASATITLAGPTGLKTAGASWAGSASYLPASVSVPFQVDKEMITLTVHGPLVVTSGASATAPLAADLAEQPDGSYAGALGLVSVTFRRLDGSLLCQAPAAPTTTGRATATCSVSQAVGTQAVIATATSATYTGLADVGVSTVTTSASNAGAGGTGPRDTGFVATAAKKGAPTGNVVLAVPSPGGIAVLSSSSLTGLVVSCGGHPRTCTGTLDASVTLRYVDPATGVASAPVGPATVHLDLRDLGDPSGGVSPDGWAETVAGALSDALGTPTSPVLLDYGDFKLVG
jgi:alpha-tubulin suppressor-like RCC1 family protein